MPITDTLGILLRLIDTQSAAYIHEVASYLKTIMSKKFFNLDLCGPTDHGFCVAVIKNI